MADVVVGVSDGVPEGGMRQFTIDDVAVLVCRAGGTLHAVDGVCPHRGALLAGGRLDGTVVTCPWHDWEFDCADGHGITNPQSQVKCYSVKERDGHVIIEWPDEA